MPLRLRRGNEELDQSCERARWVRISLLRHPPRPARSQAPRLHRQFHGFRHLHRVPGMGDAGALEITPRRSPVPSPPPFDGVDPGVSTITGILLSSMIMRMFTVDRCSCSSRSAMPVVADRRSAISSSCAGHVDHAGQDHLEVVLRQHLVVAGGASRSAFDRAHFLAQHLQRHQRPACSLARQPECAACISLVKQPAVLGR